MEKQKDNSQGKSEVLQEGVITEDGLKKLQSLIGINLRVSNKFNELASREAIRNYANGIGDPNPLWRDEQYAAQTRYKTLVAPPSWLYSVFPTFVPLGLPGVHGFHSGNDWEFYKPVLCGDVIRPECRLTGYEQKRSKFAGNMVILHYEARYINQDKELVAKARAWSVRAERRATRGKGKYSKIKLPHPWKEEELKKVEEEVLSEKVCGSEIRYWEDVYVGDELQPVIKGPFGLTDMVSYTVGSATMSLRAHHLALELYRRHPAWAFRDPNTYALEPIFAVHYNNEAANAAGLPYPYAIGVQIQSWLIHLLTNWMGDEGWLKKNYAEYRKFVYFSDVVWFKGKVIKKYVDEESECCVDIDTSAYNQRGENPVPGHSTVVLPSREKSTWPVIRRLPSDEKNEQKQAHS